MPNTPDEDGLTITRQRELPAGLKDLVAESRAEGYEFLERLVREWNSGGNRFDRDGEALFSAWIAGRLVGVCGVNCDPYLNDAGVARLRHLYVAGDVRRRGIGHNLVARSLGHARGRFRRVRLRTHAASAFYESLGFLKSCEENATHELSVSTPPSAP